MRRHELADAAETYIYDCVDTFDTSRVDVYAEANGEYIQSVGGMSDQRDEVAAVIAKAKERFLGVGAEQYQISETEQAFERSTIGTMLVGMDEELVDQINYACMIDVLICRRLRSGADSQVLGALLSLQHDIGESAYAAVCQAVIVRRHLDRLIELGEYTPRGEGDYVAQLAAECAEAGAQLTPDTPAGLDAIEAAFSRQTLAGEHGDGLDFIAAECARMDDDGAGGQ